MLKFFEISSHIRRFRVSTLKFKSEIINVQPTQICLKSWRDSKSKENTFYFYLLSITITIMDTMSNDDSQFLFYGNLTDRESPGET